MNKKLTWRTMLKCGLFVIIACSILYYCISKPQLETRYYKEEFSRSENTNVLGEFTNGTHISQVYTCNAEYIKGISVLFANYGNIPSGTLEISVSKGEDVLYKGNIIAVDLPDSEDYYIDFGEKIPVEVGSRITIDIVSYGGQENAAVTLWASEKKNDCNLYVNGIERENTLVMVPDEYVSYPFTKKYVEIVAAIILSWILICNYEIKCEKKRKINAGIELIRIFDKYKFLLFQLVGRDFKTKYRRSYLGILWSLLNPIFMMVIVSSVFSFVFRFNIEKFPVYLILGQITFAFFSEATQIGTTTITGAGQMIKKVYLPKYIFPLSKVMFSFVNFLITFVAVIGVLIFFKVTPTVNMLFLPLWLAEYFIFTLGVSFFLAAMMVFLRDTQYLYSVVILAWGYITPIFYPVDSLSPIMQKLMNLNPLYHYINYLRFILLYGECPSLKQNLMCLGLAVGALILGGTYFFKKQDKFILYI